MVGVERFELPTLWSQTRCATRLRYTPSFAAYKVPGAAVQPLNRETATNATRFSQSRAIAVSAQTP